MSKLRTLALPTVAAASAAPFAAQAASFGTSASASATPMLLASATLFVPGLLLILGLLRRNRPVAAAA